MCINGKKSLEKIEVRSEWRLLKASRVKIAVIPAKYPKGIRRNDGVITRPFALSKCHN